MYFKGFFYTTHFLLVLSASVLLAPSVISAATFTVTKTADTNDGICNNDCSLREAIAAANDASGDDVIGFSPFFSLPRTILLNSQIVIESSGAVSIQTPAGLIISGNSANRIFFVDTGAVFSLTNLVLQSGRADNGAAIYIRRLASVQLNNVNLSLNQATVSGGAIFQEPGGSLVMTNSTLSTNSATGPGGAILSEGESAFDNVTISQSSTGQTGGAIHLRGGANLEGSSLQIYQNTATVAGGGIFVGAEGSVQITNSRLRNNGAPTGGFSRNEGTLRIENSPVYDNRATGIGGGAGISNIGTVDLVNITFCGNESYGDGGGAISNLPSGTVNATSITVARNLAPNGGGINNSGASFNSRNSLYGDNTASAGSSPDFLGSFNSLGYNLIETTEGTIITGTITGDRLNEDPQLLPIDNLQGSVNSFSFLSTSPVVDSGDPNVPLIDQRGEARPQDGDLDGIAANDIGAFEKQIAVIEVTKTTDTDDNVCDSDCSLREAVKRANTDISKEHGIRFALPGSSQPTQITLTLGDISIARNSNLFIRGLGQQMLSLSGNDQSRVFFMDNSVRLALMDLTLTNGRSEGGGAISGGAVVGLRNIVVKDSRSTWFEGGGAYLSGLLFADNVEFSNNLAPDDGGGLYMQGRATIRNSRFLNNVGVNGAGVRGSLIMTNCLISGNRSMLFTAGYQGFGGGIHAGDESVIRDTTIIDNQADGDGGGLYSDSRVTVIDSLIANNRAQNGGGVAQSTHAQIALVNVTVSGNQAVLDGGGVARSDAGFFSFLRLTSTTVAFNTAGRNGGGIFMAFEPGIRMGNTIVANNTAMNGQDIFGPIVSEGYNLIGNNTGANLQGDLTGVILGIDPLMDPRLLLNGGTTANHALRAGSPAIDAGSSSIHTLTVDQRGKPRPYNAPDIPEPSGGNGSDIGAFERQKVDVSGLELVTVSGRVLTPSGLGVRNTVVSLIDAKGLIRTATTSSFGLFTFPNVPTGESYTTRVNSKRYRFAPQIITLNTEMQDLELVGLE